MKRRGDLLGAVAALCLGCMSDPGVSGSGGPSATGGGAGSGGPAGPPGSSTGGSGGPATLPPPMLPPPGPAGMGGSGPSPDDRKCGFQKYQLERTPAELLLLLDRSGSMQEKVGNDTRWALVTSAIDEVVMKTNDLVAWGLKFYPTPPTRDGCAVTVPAEVPIAAQNHRALSAAIKTTGALPIDGGGVGPATPTALAVRQTTAYLKTLPPPKGARYILLATDGLPNCQTDYIPALQQAAATGYKTFVVGVNIPKGDAILGMMAQAGGVPRAGTPSYYAVNVRQDLVDALGQITLQVANCTFPLDKPPPSPEDVAVDVGTPPSAQRIPRDTSQTSGWDYSSAARTGIQIHGPLCDQIKAGKVANVQITFGCPNIPIP